MATYNLRRFAHADGLKAIAHEPIPCRERAYRTQGETMDLRQINFGIEIETIKRTRERVAQAIQSVVGGQVRHIGSPGSFLPSTCLRRCFGRQAIPRLGRRST